jgi:hypothetical protein
MVEVMSSGEQEEEEDEDEDDEDDETDGDGGNETEGGESYDAGGTSAWDIDEDELHLDAARIYEKTIVQLGRRLGDSLGSTDATMTEN